MHFLPDDHKLLCLRPTWHIWTTFSGQFIIHNLFLMSVEITGVNHSSITELRFFFVFIHIFFYYLRKFYRKMSEVNKFVRRKSVIVDNQNYNSIKCSDPLTATMAKRRLLPVQSHHSHTHNSETEQSRYKLCPISPSLFNSTRA